MIWINSPRRNDQTPTIEFGHTHDYLIGVGDVYTLEKICIRK
jgi:hypothetical protein